MDEGKGTRQGEMPCLSMKTCFPGKVEKWIFRLEKSNKNNCKCQNGYMLQGTGEGIGEIMERKCKNSQNLESSSLLEYLS